MLKWLQVFWLLLPNFWLQAQEVDLLQSFNPELCNPVDMQVEQVLTADGNVIKVHSGHEKKWPSVSIYAPEQGWDLSSFAYVEVVVVNLSDGVLPLSVRVDSLPKTEKKPLQTTSGTQVDAGETVTLQIQLDRRREDAPDLFGMKDYPQGFWAEKYIHSDRISRINIFLHQPIRDYDFKVLSVKAKGVYRPEPWETKPSKEFFPFIDAFGQFNHRTWPGKIETLEELKASVAKEEEDLNRHPGAQNWDEFGGWANGPQLEATGHFRTEKVGEQWWLVDPKGHVFFSHGITCVRSGCSTIVDDRKDWFETLPDAKSEPQFYSVQKAVNFGHFKGKTPTTFDFGEHNLLLKYGNTWKEQHADMAHRRLKSWGMNTLGLWSDKDICENGQRRTPYVTWVHYWPVNLLGKTSGWKKFIDVYDPKTWESLQARAEKFLATAKDDAYCIGVFVDNELPWEEDNSIALFTLNSPAKQVAKQVFAEDLKAKYKTIEGLNASWKSNYKSWENFLQQQSLPNLKHANEDLKIFSSKSADTYFSKVRAIVKGVAPNTLYLGCRFNGDFEYAAKIAAKYCDVVSYNLYRYSVKGFQVGGGLDVPAIIGEWHFGATDRGPFSPGLKSVASQAERANIYKKYVGQVLENKNFVGCHWFQYNDEATSGRPLDSENCQIGFVDVTDAPYPETVEACREVGYKIYPGE